MQAGSRLGGLCLSLAVSALVGGGFGLALDQGWLPPGLEEGPLWDWSLELPGGSSIHVLSGPWWPALVLGVWAAGLLGSGVLLRPLRPWLKLPAALLVAPSFVLVGIPALLVGLSSLPERLAGGGNPFAAWADVQALLEGVLFPDPDDHDPVLGLLLVSALVTFGVALTPRLAARQGPAWVLASVGPLAGLCGFLVFVAGLPILDHELILDRAAWLLLAALPLVTVLVGALEGAWRAWRRRGRARPGRTGRRLRAAAGWSTVPLFSLAVAFTLPRALAAIALHDPARIERDPQGWLRLLDRLGAPAQEAFLAALATGPHPQLFTVALDRGRRQLDLAEEIRRDLPCASPRGERALLTAAAELEQEGRALLLRVLRRSPAPIQRQRAARRLARGPGVPEPVFLSVLADDPSWHLRITAAELLVGQALEHDQAGLVAAGLSQATPDPEGSRLHPLLVALLRRGIPPHVPARPWGPPEHPATVRAYRCGGPGPPPAARELLAALGNEAFQLTVLREGLVHPDQRVRAVAAKWLLDGKEAALAPAELEACEEALLRE